MKEQVDEIYFRFLNEFDSLSWKKRPLKMLGIHFLVFLVLPNFLSFLVRSASLHAVTKLFETLTSIGIDVESVSVVVTSIIENRFFGGFVGLFFSFILISLYWHGAFLKKRWIKPTLGYKKLLEQTETKLRTIVNFTNPPELTLVFEELQSSQASTRHLTFLLNEIQNAKDLQADA